MKVVGDLKGLIGEIATDYISVNSESFRSNYPGPAGSDGPIGPEGVGVHHLKGTSTTQNEGDFAYPGETDTYTFYPDANETYPLGWFNVRNGQDAYNYAVTAGYTGTEEDFYLELASIREYFEQSEVNANQSQVNADQVELDAAQVAADRVIVVDAKAIVLAAKDATVESADTVQEIFLGTKASDPIVDNQGNPLVIGVMYFNSTSGTLRIWDGVTWNLGAFSVAGAVTSVNGRDGVVELTKTDVGLGNVQNVDTTNATNIHSGILSVSRLADSGVVAGTYKSVTVDTKGRVTAGTNPTTLAGYGITDAYTKAEIGIELALKATVASPTFTGVPSAPTASVGTNTSQLATTAFVNAEINKIEEW